MNKIRLYKIGVFSLLAGMLSFASLAQQTHIIMVGPNSSNTFSPADLTVAMGDTILFQWKSGNHPTQSDDAVTIPNFKMDASNTSHKVLVNFSGSVRYYCTAHGGTGGTGMSGVINVNNNPQGISSNNSISSFSVFPNPVNDKLNLKFTVAKEGMVTAKVIDILGNEAYTLISERKAPGDYTGSYLLSGKIARGIYFVRMSVGNDVSMKRISVE